MVPKHFSTRNILIGNLSGRFQAMANQVFNPATEAARPYVGCFSVRDAVMAARCAGLPIRKGEWPAFIADALREAEAVNAPTRALQVALGAQRLLSNRKEAVSSFLRETLLETGPATLKLERAPIRIELSSAHNKSSRERWVEMRIHFPAAWGLPEAELQQLANLRFEMKTGADEIKARSAPLDSSPGCCSFLFPLGMMGSLSSPLSIVAQRQAA